MAVNLNLPEFKTDPYYTKAQDLSYTTGEGILSGKLPEFYQGLGQTGSKEFQDMLALVNRNTATAVNENLVRRNISRSGVGAASIAKQSADTSATLSWQDYLKAAGEKTGLMNTGLETISGVRGAGLQYAGQENQFGMQGAELKLSADKFNEEMAFKEKQAAEQKKASKNAMWTQILSSGIGMLGTIGGAMIAGPAGAAIGGSLGSAVGGKPSGGGMDFSSSFFGDINR